MEGESIYNWIKEEVRPPPKPKRYRSKHDPKAAPSNSTIKAPRKAAATFGKSVKDELNPKQFLKTREKTGATVVSKTRRKRHMH